MRATITAILVGLSLATPPAMAAPAPGPSIKEQAELKKAGKECGNGIFIEHAEGWSTQLCHLRKDSITVKKGDTVKVGQKIAEVGLSGVSDHPQVSLTVRHNGIDRRLTDVHGHVIREILA